MAITEVHGERSTPSNPGSYNDVVHERGGIDDSETMAVFTQRLIRYRQEMVGGGQDELRSCVLGDDVEVEKVEGVI